MDYIFPGYQPFDGAVCENIRITDNVFEDVFAGVGSHSMIYDRPYRNIVIQGNTFRNVKKRAVWCLNYVDSAVEDNIIENAGGGVLGELHVFPEYPSYTGNCCRNGRKPPECGHFREK